MTSPTFEWKQEKGQKNDKQNDKKGNTRGIQKNVTKEVTKQKRKKTWQKGDMKRCKKVIKEWEKSGDNERKQKKCKIRPEKQIKM